MITADCRGILANLAGMRGFERRGSDFSHCILLSIGRALLTWSLIGELSLLELLSSFMLDWTVVTHLALRWQIR